MLLPHKTHDALEVRKRNQRLSEHLYSVKKKGETETIVMLHNLFHIIFNGKTVHRHKHKNKTKGTNLESIKCRPCQVNGKASENAGILKFRQYL